MAFPRSRRASGAQTTGSERRRQSRERRSRQPETTLESLQDSKVRLHRRLSWALGFTLILVVVGVLVAGYYQEFYRPPRVWAGQVRDVRFTMGDLVQRIRVEQGLSGQVDLSKDPFDHLQRLLHAEMLRQDAPSLGINVTEELVEETLRSQFYPTVRAAQSTDPGQLEQEYQNNFQMFLTQSGLSESEYRKIIREILRRQMLYFQLGRNIEDPLEQVEVEWIRLELDGRVTNADVLKRLELEEFANVAQNIGKSAGFADPSGYVGWIPRPAFPDIGLVLFGDEEKHLEPLAVGEISRPLFIGDAIYIVHKLSDIQVKPLSDIMRARVNAQLLDDWEKDRLKQGADEGYVKMRYNSAWYAWTAEQIAVSAPRNRETQR